MGRILMLAQGCIVDKRHTIRHLLLMSGFDWSDKKNRMLERDRGICFEDVIVCIQNGDVLAVIRHPNRDRYPNQNMIVINISGYVWLIPYIKQKGIRFLKTIIPSRKATREYLQ